MKTDLKDAFVGKCEQCKRENVKVRRVEAIGMGRESRGWYNLCFECYGPRVTFKSRGRTFTAPMRDWKKKEREEGVNTT